MKKFVAELIGTFMLVFVGTGAVVFGNGLDGLGHLGIAFAFGLAIVVAAYSIGTVSGAHLNPAVSIAMFVNKRLSSSELVNYILGQVVGAFIASGAVFFLLANSGMSTWLTQVCQLLVLVKMPWQTVSLSLVVSCLKSSQLSCLYWLS